ncbi:MAG: hypothetical protein BRD55_10200 [Bacteroidetes bacterium SW_9_63_38]|nr:MAG: hypothetical protein BRD55_10200 [Bacteroidetes bacterium SW_9_63_38]
MSVLLLAVAFVVPGVLAQAPQTGGQPKMLSSSDVSDEEINKVAKIAVKTQMATRKERQKLRRDMKKKYGNPQQMDSTEKAQARQEIRKKQMAMQKKTMKTMQKEAKKKDMDASKVQRVLQSAQQDSTLKKRLETAMREEAKSQRPQRKGPGMKKGGGSGQ